MTKKTELKNINDEIINQEKEKINQIKLLSLKNEIKHVDNLINIMQID